eukprot:3595715-Pyramimonas_sp.AAC.1
MSPAVTPFVCRQTAESTFGLSAGRQILLLLAIFVGLFGSNISAIMVPKSLDDLVAFVLLMVSKVIARANHPMR